MPYFALYAAGCKGVGVGVSNDLTSDGEIDPGDTSAIRPLR